MNATIPFSDNSPPPNEARIAYAAAIGLTLDKWRISQGWNPLPHSNDKDSPQNRAVAVWLELLQDAGVPVEQIQNCYRAAMALRAERKAAGEKLDQLTATDLIVEWRAIKRLNDELDKTRLLPETAQTQCWRCYGSGFEENLQGEVIGRCEHGALDDEGIRARQERQARLRRELLQVAANRMPAPPIKPVTHPLDQIPRIKENLICDKCGAVWSTEYDFNNYDGAPCIRLIDATTEPPLACDGFYRTRVKPKQ